MDILQYNVLADSDKDSSRYGYQKSVGKGNGNDAKIGFKVNSPFRVFLYSIEMFRIVSMLYNYLSQNKIWNITRYLIYSNGKPRAGGDIFCDIWPIAFMVNDYVF